MAPSLSGIVTGAGRRMRRAPVQYEAEPAPAPRVARQLAEARRYAGLTRMSKLRGRALIADLDLYLVLWSLR